MRTSIRSVAAVLLWSLMGLYPCAFGQHANVEKSVFGKLPDGHEVFAFTLVNGHHAEVRVITYGAIVTSLLVPDRSGKLQDVVLGYDSLEGYVHDKSFFGAIVGRYANRISKGRFTLDGKEYQLSINDGENHLHGGKSGFYKALWDAHVVSDSLGPSVQLTYRSPAGEEGYPGTVTISVRYTLTEETGLRIDYEATTDHPTILNPTHHSYFNLSGSCTSAILDELLTIDADSITPVDRELIPTGAYTSVAGTPMDFRTPAAIGSRINNSFEQLAFGTGYDHNWVLRNFDGKVRKVAELYDTTSGRVMTVSTDQPGLQFYSGNFLDGTIRGKNSVPYQFRTGLCLEAQAFSRFAEQAAVSVRGFETGAGVSPDDSVSVFHKVEGGGMCGDTADTTVIPIRKPVTPSFYSAGVNPVDYLCFVG